MEQLSQFEVERLKIHPSRRLFILFYATDITIPESSQRASVTLYQPCNSTLGRTLWAGLGSSRVRSVWPNLWFSLENKENRDGNVSLLFVLQHVCQAQGPCGPTSGNSCSKKRDAGQTMGHPWYGLHWGALLGTWLGLAAWSKPLFLALLQLLLFSSILLLSSKSR